MRKSYKALQQCLTPDFLIGQLRQRFSQFSDHRASNTHFNLSDLLMSGFAMFSLKYASLLQFESQTDVERENLHHLYGIEQLCTDSQMGKVLDKVCPDKIKEIYAENFKELHRLAITKAYRYYQQYLIIALDGVTHFESKKVHCCGCLEKKHQDGSVSYSHSMLCAMVVNPGQKEVFVLGTEPIIYQDGREKNDCERNASKRLLAWMAKHYQGQNLLITEDALYSNAPNIQEITDNNWAYVLGIKPDGNKSLFKAFEQTNPSARLKEFSCLQNGIQHQFKYVNNLPLNSSNAEVRVNVLIYQQKDKKGKTTQFSWVTNLELTPKSVVEVIKIGRSGWTMEPGGEHCHRR